MSTFCTPPGPARELLGGLGTSGQHGTGPPVCQRRVGSPGTCTYVGGLSALFQSQAMAAPSGPHRSRLAGVARKTEREKRKRSRVTPEQLVHLERLFAMDRSPTAARRKEISDMLGMQERQTQIWFQNRRAKAKLQDGKKVRASSVETPPDAPPDLVTGYEAELHDLLHEDAPVTIIPCTDLSVGTWRRVVTSARKHDLVAYLCDVKRCLTWFIHSSGHGFKMEIPFDSIVDTEFANAAPGSGLASFILSRPPTFYLESSPSPLDLARGTEPARHWKKCTDWTEDQQATKVLRHDLVGSAVQLAHVLRHLSERASRSDIQLHSPSYLPQKTSSPMDVQQLPLTALAGAGHGYQPDCVEFRQPNNPVPTHKRSYSLPVADPRFSLPNTPDPPAVPPRYSVISEPGPAAYHMYSRHPAVNVGQSSAYPNYMGMSLPHSHSLLSANGESSRSFSPHTLQRPYSTGATHSLSCEEDRTVLTFSDRLQPPPSSASTPYGTPSPPILTTPFYPTGSVPNTCPVSPYEPAIPVVSTMPGTSNSGINY